MEEGIVGVDCVGGGEAALGYDTEGRLGSPSSVAFFLVEVKIRTQTVFESALVSSSDYSSHTQQLQPSLESSQNPIAQTSQLRHLQPFIRHGSLS